MTATQTFLVVCEGPSDLRVAKVLVDRVLEEVADWVVPAFRGERREDSFLQWSSLKKRQDVPRRLGHSPDGWGPDSEVARRALHVASTLDGVDGVILLRDADKSSGDEKRASIRAAITAARPARPVAFGVACAKIEAWLLAGLTPAAETRDAVRKELGFDAITQPEDLTAAEDNAKTNAKRVLALFATLTEACAELERVELELLRANGRQTGVTDFLCQVRCKLGRLLSGHIPPAAWCNCAEQH